MYLNLADAIAAKAAALINKNIRCIESYLIKSVPIVKYSGYGIEG